MSQPKYDVTIKLLKELRKAIAGAGRDDIEIVLSDESDDFDDTVDDEIVFKVGGTKVDGYSVQSGPYGVSLNLYSGEGANFGVQTLAEGDVFSTVSLVQNIVGRLDEIAPRSAAPTP